MNTTTHPLTELAGKLATVLHDLARAWAAAEEEIDDHDQQDALHNALSKGYPLGVDLDDAAAAAGEWAEHVEQVMNAQPTVLQLVADEIGKDVAAVNKTCAKDGPDPDEAYRNWQNGGLSGEVGRFGGIFTPSLIANLGMLLLAIDNGDTDRIENSADQFARAYRSARVHSRT